MRPVRMLCLLASSLSAVFAVTGCADDTDPLQPNAADVPASAAVTTSGVRVGYYASPTGSSSGTGSYTNPWDLKTALAGGRGKVVPGDTIWVRGGLYRGAFNSYVKGTATKPVVVRAYPGERATIDGRGTGLIPLKARGEYSVFWGLEITNSDGNRFTAGRPQGIYALAPHLKFINMIVHDHKVGFTLSNESPGAEVYGTLVYNNGWQGTQDSYGHAIYAKNAGSVTKVLKDNIIFNQFAYGIHAYTDGGSGSLKNIRIEGNAVFNNGSVARDVKGVNNILVGGGEPASQIVVANNMTYFSPGIGSSNIRLGYSSSDRNGDVKVTNNYVVGGSTALSMLYWQSAAISGNMLYGPSRLAAVSGSGTGYLWSGTQFRGNTGSSSAFRYGSSGYSYSTWRSKVGGSWSSTTLTAGAPTATKVFVRPNQYEKGRANVIVYNWGRLGSVTADMSRVLTSGDRYVVRSAQNFFGTPVATGTYGGGSITIPMRAVQPVQPNGGSSTPAKSTGPAFDVFVVMRAGT